MAVLASFIKYLVTLIIFALIGIAGAVVGKKWRISKDAKEAAEDAFEKELKK